MDKRNRIDLLLHIWVRLDEIKNLLSVIEKGMDAEMKTDTGEMYSVVSIMKRQLEEVIGEIDKNI